MVHTRKLDMKEDYSWKKQQTSRTVRGFYRLQGGREIVYLLFTCTLLSSTISFVAESFKRLTQYQYDDSD